jgi:hypothetical protein
MARGRQIFIPPIASVKNGSRAVTAQEPSEGQRRRQPPLARTNSNIISSPLAKNSKRPIVDNLLAHQAIPTSEGGDGTPAQQAMVEERYEKKITPPTIHNSRAASS